MVLNIESQTIRNGVMKSHEFRRHLQQAIADNGPRSIDGIYPVKTYWQGGKECAVPEFSDKMEDALEKACELATRFQEPEYMVFIKDLESIDKYVKGKK